MKGKLTTQRKTQNKRRHQSPEASSRTWLGHPSMVLCHIHIVTATTIAIRSYQGAPANASFSSHQRQYRSSSRSTPRLEPLIHLQCPLICGPKPGFVRVPSKVTRDCLITCSSSSVNRSPSLSSEILYNSQSKNPGVSGLGDKAFNGGKSSPTLVASIFGILSQFEVGFDG